MISTWSRTLPFEQLALQAFCRRGLAAALHENIEHEAVLINGAPMSMFPSPNGDDGFVQVPFVTELPGRALADVFGEAPADFSATSGQSDAKQ